MSPETILFRQVHPKFFDNDGILTSQAFMPFPKDDGGLSVYDGDQISAADSYDHYTRILGNASDSVWGVAGSEVAAAGLAARPDELPDFPSHALIDFGEKSEKECRKCAKKLKSAALARGLLYQPAS